MSNQGNTSPNHDSQPEDHCIQVKEGAPEELKMKVYTLSKTEEAVKTYLQENLKQGFIEKLNSPWALPMFFIKKVDKGLRPVVDYRRVNDWTVKDQYPLP